MKKIVSLLLVALLSCTMAGASLADYGSFDPNWHPTQGVSPDFLATLDKQMFPQAGYQKIGDVPEYGMEQIGPVEVASAQDVDRLAIAKALLRSLGLSEELTALLDKYVCSSYSDVVNSVPSVSPEALDSMRRHLQQGNPASYVPSLYFYTNRPNNANDTQHYATYIPLVPTTDTSGNQVMSLLDVVDMMGQKGINLGEMAKTLTQDQFDNMLFGTGGLLDQWYNPPKP